MAQLYYPVSETTSPPIFLDREALGRLDEIIEEYWPRLTKRRNQLLEEEVVAKVRRFESNIGRQLNDEETEKKKIEFRKGMEESSSIRMEREIVLYLTGRKKLLVSSFGEANKHPEMRRERARGFVMTLRAASIQASIETPLYDSRLQVSVTPEGDLIARDLLGELRIWLTSVAPPRWQQIWLQFGWLVWFLWFLLMLLLFIIILAGTPNYYLAEAHKLLADGLAPDEQQRAIELILALQSNYRDVSHQVTVPRWFWFLVMGSLLMVAMLRVVPPEVLLGIGDEQKRIEMWRRWIKFISVAVPGFFATNLLWPWLVERLVAFLGG